MKALITGCTGQDGHYLSKLLLSQGYQVYGLIRRNAQPARVPKEVIAVPGDVTDPQVVQIVDDIWPNEIYHLAAMSHVWESFKVPRVTFEINALGTLNMLEAAKKTRARFYNASTSELFGSTPPPQNETTPFHPRSPYAVAKMAAYWLTVNYREAYLVHASNGILFNHESPLRGADFVTQKIAQGVADIKAGVANNIVLGNLDAKRDWGHAEDFVYGMWLMLQQDEPGDYVLATGESHSVRDVLDHAFGMIGIDDWTDYVITDPKYTRPAEVESLVGDPSKAKLRLGWEPKHTFKEVITEMVNARCGEY